jgi:hypothetical protein
MPKLGFVQGKPWLPDRRHHNGAGFRDDET